MADTLATQRDDRAGTVRVGHEGSTRVLVMDYPRLNTIVHGIRAGLSAALLDAELDTSVDSVVLIGAGGNFCGGADLDEFARGTALSPPSLHGHIIPFIESMTKPVVAAHQRFALGGGLELALGCHARVASTSARIGLPETNFGLIPGAGGTVRLPRAVGATRAARMIAMAEVVTAADLAGYGLFDALCDTDTHAAAIALAHRMAGQGGPLPRLRDRDVDSADPQILAALQLADRPSARATELAVASVRRATTAHVDQALTEEYSAFLGLLMGNESAALRHVFQAERSAQRVPGLPRPGQVRRLTLAGAGGLAHDLAAAATSAGIEVAPDGDLFLAADTDAPGAIRLRAVVPTARLVEVVRTPQTDPSDLAAAMSVLRRLHRVPICVADRPGLLVERLIRALEDHGLRSGHFTTFKSMELERAGQGAWVNDTALRCLLALVTEGARALDDGTALRPGDIDLAMVQAIGFPAGLGGPMFWATSRGLPLTLIQIARLATDTGDPFWTPSPWFRAPNSHVA